MTLSCYWRMFGPYSLALGWYTARHVHNVPETVISSQVLCASGVIFGGTYFGALIRRLLGRSCIRGLLRLAALY
ncbi:hypothetical protein BDZ97DRAFT_1804888 [Flammula alnicola]|nr:hypothetical protein BDZ97DRAFT_1804888 [Flammula alnicola]